MSDNLGDLTTPEEYINYYYPLVKQRLSSSGLQLSKVGFFGFFLNLMGFTQYDVKTYFDTLFREAFLATSDDDENLDLHASIYGYDTISAVPASITGNLVITTDNLPSGINLTSAEICIESLEITIDNMTYTSDAVYTISGNSCEIKKASGDIIYVPFTTTNNSVPISDLIQYTTSTTNVTLPYYQKGTYYQKIIELDDDGYIYDIAVSIQTSDDSDYVDYEVRYIKYSTTASEAAVFARYLSGNKLLIEFGSGLHGKYVSEADVKIVLKVTQGSSGNVSSNTVVPTDGQVRVYDSDSQSGYNITPDTIVSVEVDYAQSGTDVLSGDDLRTAIISYIQTRDNMLSETDFYNILDNYFDDVLLMFKKTSVVENTIYAFLLFRDSYKVPILTKSVSILHDEFNSSNLNYIYKPTFTIDDIEYVSPFLYVFDEFMRDYPGYIYYEEYSVYFTSMEYADDDTSDELELIPLSLYFEYRPGSSGTRITARSYQTISDYVMHINIPILEISACMDVYDDNIQEYLYVNATNGGLIEDCVDVEILIYQSDTLLFTYSVTNVCLLGDISDILTLKIYEHPSDDWDVCGTSTTLSEDNDSGPFSVIDTESHILNIPVMRSEDYEEDQTYYDDKFLAGMGSLSGDENRMISDDFQIRFLNTEIIESDILAPLTVQGHDFEITLPLVLHITVVGYKQQILDDALDTLTITDDLKATLATKLYDDYTGTSVSFYRTQIVDVIHNLSWVKYCEVAVYDSSEEAVEIPDANFETNDQIDIIDELDKMGAVTYCPVYIYWDLDDINVTLKFE